MFYPEAIILPSGDSPYSSDLIVSLYESEAVLKDSSPFPSVDAKKKIQQNRWEVGEIDHVIRLVGIHQLMSWTYMDREQNL